MVGAGIQTWLPRNCQNKKVNPKDSQDESVYLVFLRFLSVVLFFHYLSDHIHCNYVNYHQQVYNSYPERGKTLYCSGSSDGKESACNVGDLGLIPGLERFPGDGNDNLLQYFCLKNPMDRGALAGYSPWGHKESDTTQQLYNKKYNNDIKEINLYFLK